MKSDCPCCSRLSYEACFKPYHDGALPPTALALMRSRYSAYALKNAKYIIDTTHPQSPYFDQDRKKWERGILQFSNTTEFVKLEILETGENSVHFIAHLRQNGQPLILDEKSLFEKINGKWLYLSGNFSTRS